MPSPFTTDNPTWGAVRASKLHHSNFAMSHLSIHSPLSSNTYCCNQILHLIWQSQWTTFCLTFYTKYSGAMRVSHKMAMQSKTTSCQVLKTILWGILRHDLTCIQIMSCTILERVVQGFNVYNQFQPIWECRSIKRNSSQLTSEVKHSHATKWRSMCNNTLQRDLLTLAIRGENYDLIKQQPFIENSLGR